MDTELKKTLITVGCIGTGGFVGNRVGDALGLLSWFRLPAILAGSITGATIAHYTKKRMPHSKARHFGQAQPEMKHGDMRVAMTWSNGMSSISPAFQSVPETELLETISTAILDTATNEFGTGAAQAFPATVDVVYGNKYFTGKVELDEELIPILNLKEGGVSTTPLLRSKAIDAYQKRDAVERATLKVMHANTIPVSEATGPVQDFSIPIPQ
jgi:hypothetical protein